MGKCVASIRKGRRGRKEAIDKGGEKGGRRLCPPAFEREDLMQLMNSIIVIPLKAVFLKYGGRKEERFHF